MTTPDPEAAAEQDAARVLVVSSDSAVAAFLVSLLERAGFAAVAGPADEAAAETTSASPPYDLVLVDAETEPVRSIRSLADPQRARTHIAVLGALGAEDTAEAAAVDAGSTTWIARPIDDSDLVSLVGRAARA